MKIPCVIVFLKSDGHMILNTGQYTGIKVLTDQEIYDAYTELQQFDINDLFFKHCQLDDENQNNLNHGSIPTYNDQTDEITWELSQQQQEEQSINSKVAELEQIVADIAQLQLGL